MSCCLIFGKINKVWSDVYTKALIATRENLPVSFEMLGNKDRIGTVQVTAWGFCEHDWWMTPCSKAGECLSCKDHACIKDLPKSLEKLQDFEKIVSNEIKRADDEIRQGNNGAKSWLVYHSKKLAIIRTLINMLENDNLPEGYIIRVPAELDESLTKIALREHGLQAEVTVESKATNEVATLSQSNFLAILQGKL